MNIFTLYSIHASPLFFYYEVITLFPFSFIFHPQIKKKKIQWKYFTMQCGDSSIFWFCEYSTHLCQFKASSMCVQLYVGLLDGESPMFSQICSTHEFRPVCTVFLSLNLSWDLKPAELSSASGEVFLKNGMEKDDINFKCITHFLFHCLK